MSLTKELMELMERIIEGIPLKNRHTYTLRGPHKVLWWGDADPTSFFFNATRKPEKNQYNFFLL